MYTQTIRIEGRQIPCTWWPTCCASKGSGGGDCGSIVYNSPRFLGHGKSSSGLEKNANVLIQKGREAMREIRPVCLSQQQVSILESVIKEAISRHLEKYRRIVARVENDNRRIRKCVEDARLYGIHSFCKDVLMVADLLEKTTRSITEEELANSSPPFKNFYEGVRLIDEKLCKIFSKHGLEKMNSIGLEYNSAEHEIVSRVPSVDALPGTVVKIVKEGYKLHGRILRTAQVGLAIEAQPHFKAQ